MLTPEILKVHWFHLIYVNVNSGNVEIAMICIAFLNVNSVNFEIQLIFITFLAIKSENVEMSNFWKLTPGNY